MAASPAPHASRFNLFVGCFRARQCRFRNLDEARHGVHRQVVACARLEDHSVDSPTSTLRKRRTLNIFPGGNRSVISTREFHCYLVPSPIATVTVLLRTM